MFLEWKPNKSNSGTLLAAAIYFLCLEMYKISQDEYVCITILVGMT